MPPGITVRGQSNKKDLFQITITRVEMNYNLHSFYIVTTNVIEYPF